MVNITFGGGLNELNDIAIPSDEAILGQNFELGLGNTKFKRRAPFDLVGTATNASEIHGLHQLIERDGTKTTLVAAGTDMYTFDGTTFTDKGNINANGELHDFAWELDETIIIVDRAKVEQVLEWDGTTLSTLTTGLGVNFFAKYGLVANGRAFMANVTTATTANPHMLVASAFENRESYDTSARGGAGGFTTGNEAFFLLTPDFKPINGMVAFQQDIVISTEGGKLYRLVGDDASNYRFVDYYAGSAAIGDNAFVNAGDDVFYMRSGGIIESLRSTDRYGDVGTDDVSLKVQDSVADQISTRIIYDQSNKKVLFFLSSKILVLFKDLINSELSPWSNYKTAHASAFNTSAARYMQSPVTATTTNSVFFGDDDGNIYDLNGTGTDGDAGTTDIQTIRKLPLQGFKYDEILKGRIFYRRKGICNLNLSFEWGDERTTTDLIIALKGTVGQQGNFYGGEQYYGGDFYYNEGLGGAGTPVSKGFSVVGQGSSVFATLDITTNETFEIDFFQL